MNLDRLFPFIELIGWLVLIPISFFIMGYIFYKILDCISIFISWREEAEKLNENSFLSGNTFAEFEMNIDQNNFSQDMKVHEVRCSFNENYKYIFKWISCNELIFIRKNSPKTFISSFFRSNRNKFPEISTKNYVHFAENKAHITARYVTGRLPALWILTLIFPSFGLVGFFSDDDTILGIIKFIFILAFTLFIWAIAKYDAINNIKKGLDKILSLE